MLNAESSDRQLFDTLVAMIEPLQDLHVSLDRPGTSDSYRGLRRDAYDTDGKEAFLARAQKAAHILERKYFTGPARSVCAAMFVFPAFLEILDIWGSLASVISAMAPSSIS